MGGTRENEEQELAVVDDVVVVLFSFSFLSDL